MKKTLAWILALTLTLGLTACGGGDKPSGGGGKPSGGGDKPPQETTQPKPEPTKEPEKEPEKKPAAGDFEAITVVDNDECKIVITGEGTDEFWGYMLKVELENKSADTTYNFTVDDSAINGVEVNNLFGAEVAPGKKSNEKLYFSDSNLDRYDIGEYTDLDLVFRVHDSNDWSADPVALEEIHVYPQGKDQATKYTWQSQPEDCVLYDDNGTKVTLLGYHEDDLWGFTVDFLLENNSDINLRYNADEVSVNGLMLDPFYGTDLRAGMCKFSSMSWTKTDMEDNNIDVVENVEFLYTISDADDWMADPIFEDVIVLKP